MSNWQEKNNWLIKTFKFENFVKAADFITQIVPLAEQANHHPDIELHDYKLVTIKLQTHEAGNVVTDKDQQLAIEIDKLYK